MCKVYPGKNSDQSVILLERWFVLFVNFCLRPRTVPIRSWYTAQIRGFRHHLVFVIWLIRMLITKGVNRIISYLPANNATHREDARQVWCEGDKISHGVDVTVYFVDKTIPKIFLVNALGSTIFMDEHIKLHFKPDTCRFLTYIRKKRFVKNKKILQRKFKMKKKSVYKTFTY